MATEDEDRFENTARPKGSGGGIQSKVASIPDAGADKAPQQTEDEHRPEASDQKTTTADS